MNLSEWIRAQPIAALAWTEAVAAVLAVVSDVYLAAVVTPYFTLEHLWQVALAGGATLACAVAVFSIPHRANRRHATITIALVMLVFIGSQPPYGVSVLVFAGILGCRLSFAFGIRGAVIAWVVGSVAVLLRITAQSNGMIMDPTTIYGICTFIVVLGFIFGIIAVMATYATAAVRTGADRERARIALDLHDALGHGLTTLSVELESAARLRQIDPTKADDYVQRGLRTTSAILKDVRETVAVLRSDGESSQMPFKAMLRRLIDDFAHVHDVTVRTTLELPHEPNGAVSIALFRFSQEALTNIARHANATAAEIFVSGSEREILVRVSDNGRGFAGANEGAGLRSLRERIASVNGSLKIESEPGKGTAVEATVPRSYPE